MKKVSILILETAVIEAIADPHYMFKAVNQFLQMSGKPHLFEVQLVGLTPECAAGKQLVYRACGKAAGRGRADRLDFHSGHQRGYPNGTQAERSICSLDRGAIPQWGRSGIALYWSFFAGFYRTAQRQKMFLALEFGQ